jgi:DNA-binding response OmpR family regulator
MIIDDDPVLRLVAGEALRQAGFSVREAEDGAVALRELRDHPVDLAIVDMLMPNKEGIETIRELKAMWPKARVIAISGGGRGLDTGYLLSMARSLGADAVFEKPIRPSGFVDIVRGVLEAGPGRPDSLRA